MTADQIGLHRALKLKAVVDAIVAALEAKADLPAFVNVVALPTQRIKNPLIQD